jgi:TolB-like protein/lipoprotein NlpI
MQAVCPETLRFDVYTLDLMRGELLRAGETIELRPKAFDVLRYLVEHAGRLISKDELITAIWRGISVTDDSLVQCIKDIREALSDDDHRIIKTVPRRGYLFAAAVGPSSIAVLPFVDLSGDSDKSEYLGDGLAEELINTLVQVPGLKVASRSSSFRFRGKAQDIRSIGMELNVRAVLEGSVRRAGDQLRVTAQLVNVDDGYHFWSESYDRRMGDVLAIQEDISHALVEKLQVRTRSDPPKPAVRRRTANTEAYHLYLTGRYFWAKFNKSGLAKACECWECAAAKDQAYPLPYAGLADAYYRSYLLGNIEPRVAFDKIEAAARKALELDETLAEAHVSLANMKLHSDWEFSLVQQELDRALVLNSSYAQAHHVYSHYWVARGHVEQSRLNSLHALDIDPANLTLIAHLGWHYYHAGDCARAIEACQRAVGMDPSFVLARRYLGQAYVVNRMYDKALAEFEQLMSDSESIAKAYIGLVFAMSGRRGKAEAALAGLMSESTERYVSSYHLATIALALGDIDRAFEWLNDALEERAWPMAYLKLDPMLAQIRGDWRFKLLLDRIERSS